MREFNPSNKNIHIQSWVKRQINNTIDGIKNLTNPTWEHQLLSLYRNILINGDDRIDRTGVGTRSIFDANITIDLQKGFPAVTTKLQRIKSVAGECLWMCEGSGDERRLCEITHGTRDATKRTIWTDNANADYWKPKAKFEGDLGRVYGVQWRDWFNHKGEHFDQLQSVIHKLKTNPFDRRIILSAWNPGEFDEMALPPCHILAQFYVREDALGHRYLSCKMLMRSVDTFLGLPYNITFYAMLTHMLAHITNMKVDKLVLTLGDAHIYSNHFEQVVEQLNRKPHKPPTLNCEGWGEITELGQFRVDDFTLTGYNPHSEIRAPMAV